ncbi:MAG TPA: hypothetical protein VGJ13_03820, partial [Pseudonocardiaceae bacterium]
MGWVLAVVVVLAPIATITFTSVAQGQEPVQLPRSAQSPGPASPALPVLPVVSAQVVTEPGDGAGEVSPTAPVGVSVSHGQLDAVVLTSSAGRVV